jgi:glycosyltransferase involved in cell wall biosynthesis
MNNIKDIPSKTKILYVITKSNWGGAQKYVFDLATNVDPEFEVAVILGGTGTLKTKLEEKNVRVISFPFLARNIDPFNDIKTFFSLIKLFKTERPDIVHLNSSKIGALGSVAAHLAKVPRIIFTAHGWAFNENRSWLSKKVFWFFHWITVIFSHQTIAVSEAVKRDMIASPFTKNKMTVIPNGIGEIPLKNKDDARAIILSEKTANSLPKDTFWIGTISELHSNKGLEYAIRAMKKLKDSRPEFHFIFVVMGEGGERKNLENIICELHLEQNIFLVGHKENASSLLPALDIFLLSSITEALAFVVLEAGMANLPVIASKVGGIPEIIQDMKSGILVPPRNPDEIVKALEFIISNPTKAIEFKENLYANVLENFSFKKMIADTVVIYKKRVYKTCRN